MRGKSRSGPSLHCCYNWTFRRINAFKGRSHQFAGKSVLVDARTKPEALNPALVQMSPQIGVIFSMSPSDRHLICERLGAAIKSLVSEYATRKRDVSSVVEEVLKMEKQAIWPAGFVLTATDTRDGWTRFSLHVAGTSEICASFEWRLETGEFRRTI